MDSRNKNGDGKGSVSLKMLKQRWNEIWILDKGDGVQKLKVIGRTTIGETAVSCVEFRETRPYFNPRA